MGEALPTTGRGYRGIALYRSKLLEQVLCRATQQHRVHAGNDPGVPLIHVGADGVRVHEQPDLPPAGRAEGVRHSGARARHPGKASQTPHRPGSRQSRAMPGKPRCPGVVHRREAGVETRVSWRTSTIHRRSVRLFARPAGKSGAAAVPWVPFPRPGSRGGFDPEARLRYKGKQDVPARSDRSGGMRARESIGRRLR